MGENRGARGAMARLIFAAAIVAAIVLLCAAASGITHRRAQGALPSQDTLSSQGTSSQSPSVAESASAPPATPSPTPAQFAPFGAGYGAAAVETPAPTSAPSTAAPTSAPSSAPPATLRRGSKGPEVARLQQALIELGYLTGEADGDFGANTRNAVTAFQAVNGLSADGIAGEKTLAKLYGGDALSYDEAPEMDFLVLVNREHTVDKNYVPSDLVDIADVVPSSLLKVKYRGTRANRTAVEALQAMLEDAVDAGIGNWQVSSAYRTYADQESLVEDSVSDFRQKNPGWSRARCLSATYKTVAPAGASEHQTGLAFDITVPGVSFNGTEQQKWLHKHCYEYGFIVRFTEEKESITGFLAEAWHVRYVGTAAAAVMTYQNWCLEEYCEAMGL